MVRTLSAGLEVAVPPPPVWTWLGVLMLVVLSGNVVTDATGPDVVVWGAVVGTVVTSSTVVVVP